MNPAPRPSLGGLDTQRPITEARIIHETRSVMARAGGFHAAFAAHADGAPILTPRSAGTPVREPMNAQGLGPLETLVTRPCTKS